MKQCPQCGYLLNKKKRIKKELKEKSKLEAWKKENPDKCCCKLNDFDNDEIVESNIFTKNRSPYASPREKEGPYNKRKCSNCGKFYLDYLILAFA